MSKIKGIYLKDYKKPEFKIERCELVFELFEKYVLVSNTMQIEKLDFKIDNIALNSVDLELLELYLNEWKLSEKYYRIDEDTLSIFDVPDRFTLKIKNKIYPQNNTELEGLYKSGNIFCTQNEPEGFRKITPYLDRPDIMSVFTTTVIADKDKYPILLSNGNKTNCHDFLNGRHGTT